eukprot:6279536-Pyramimonas_sp.AAC.1
MMMTAVIIHQRSERHRMHHRATSAPKIGFLKYADRERCGTLTTLRSCTERLGPLRKLGLRARRHSR